MILNRQRAVPVACRPLELFLRRVRGRLGLEHADVTVCLVSDAEMARINETFRNKSGPTDVLSFPAVARRRPAAIKFKTTTTRTATPATTRPKATATSTTTTTPASARRRSENFPRRHHAFAKNSNAFLGDIAISPRTARRNARQYGRSLDSELRILILHGLLHLLGYDHETDRGQMERLERKLRAAMGLLA